MSAFIDTDDWPIVRLHMPDHVPDPDSDAMLAELQAVYARESRFVLVMSGAEIPRHSPRFINTYLAWSRDSFGLQQTYCAGAMRIEADAERRRIYEKQAAAMEASGQAPYPYRIVEDEQAALRQADHWLGAASSS